MQPEDCGPSEDAQLVAQCQKGDCAAFDRLVTKYRNQVYATIYNLARNQDDAWDLAQETFLKAWRHIAHFRGQSKFSTWLHRIATNVTIDWVRRKQTASGVEFDDTLGLPPIAAGSATAPHAAPPPRQRLEAGEIQDRIDAALQQLSPEHRAVILLREVEGASYEEIAEATGCTLGTVMSRLFYARKKLQTLLRDVYETL
ncbi:MAG: sigma-70 family RNA polymerase sigma factor [Verrucomicrobiota bacterium]